MACLYEQQPLDVELAPGFPVRLRTMRREDGARVHRALAMLSDKSRRNRFWDTTLNMTEEMARKLTDTDDQDHLGWIALPVDEDSKIPGYAGASFWRDAPGSDRGELTLTVLDDFQRQGFGALLLSVLWFEAWHSGVRHFTGVGHRDNEMIRRWWRSAGGSVTPLAGHYDLLLDLEEPATFATRVEYDLHAGTVASEVARWFRVWGKLCSGG